MPEGHEMKLKCPACAHPVEVSAPVDGQDTLCPHCRQRLLLPAEPSQPFDTQTTAYPFLRLLFFLIYLTIVAGLVVVLIYFAAALFQKGV
jgi:hypothetical protein